MDVMGISKILAYVIAIVAIVIVLAGFLYLQSEITGLRNAGHPTSTPTVATTPNPAEIAPNYVISSTENSTTATYAGTTLVCTWGVGGQTGPLLIDNGSSNAISINYLNITNVGNNTAYISELRIQGYNSDGKEVEDTWISIRAGQYNPLGIPQQPVTLPPGQSFSVVPTGYVFYSYTIIFSRYTIVPVWSAN